ncbi:MAG: hypothetical protein U0R19_10945 [Bryobacteraceae bacterium]
MPNLVNNVWGGYENILEGGVFTWSRPFWEQPLWLWDAMFQAGVRAHYHSSQLAARAAELKPHEVAVVSLYPGLVRTEKVMQAAAWLELSNS